MPETQMTLVEILDPAVLEQYDDQERMFVYGTKLVDGFVPDARAEILWNDQATRYETGQPCYGLTEFGSIEECLDLLESAGDDPEVLIAVVNEGDDGIPDYDDNEGDVDEYIQ